MTKEVRFRWCRHHTQPKPMTPVCALGLPIPGQGEVGGFYMRACHDQTHPEVRKESCASCSFYTDAEIAEQDREAEEHVAEFLRRLKLLNPLTNRIRRDGRGRNGTETCPVCGGDQLSWSCSSWNGHIAMTCETPNCVRFME